MSATGLSCGSEVPLSEGINDYNSSTRKKSNWSNRLFLGGVNKTISASELQEKLHQFFEKYGKLTEVFVPTRTEKPYAFITFENVSDAEKALTAETIVRTNGLDNPDSSNSNPEMKHNLFSRITPVVDHGEGPRNKKRIRIENDWKETFAYAKRSNVIIQVHRSHEVRLSDFLLDPENYSSSYHPYGGSVITVVGSLRTKSTKVSLIFIDAKNNPTEFVRWLDAHPFASTVINIIYIVDNKRIIRGTVEDNLTTFILEETIKKELPDTAVVRLNIFPPPLKDKLLSSMECLWGKYFTDADATTNTDTDNVTNTNTNTTPTSIRICPKDPTHMINVICLDDTDGSDEKGGIFVQGVQLPSITAGNDTVGIKDKDNSISNNRRKNPKQKDINKDICRAFYKLQEALERYSHKRPSTSTADIVALDCGAAPGGWTKYLIDTYQCKKVYAIDPAKLSESVLNLPAVEHMPLKVENALPQLKASGVKIDIWVSDMCLLDMENQVSWLLVAKDMGIVQTGTFFVLTLKCVMGHSKATHDVQVTDQVERLKGCTKDLQTIHLFSNRIGERTIAGYIA